jgi:N-acetylglucosaminyldiphosphoundecaprenol N-acetyl-beta-D-mannosaminyltransferase
MVLQNFVRVMNVPFLNTRMSNLVELLDERLKQKEKTFVVTANPEIIMATKNDETYFKTLQEAHFVIPDGIGIVLGARLLGTPIVERLAGFDLMLHLFALAAEKGYRVYMLGAEEQVIEEAARQVKATYPNLELAGYHHGYITLEDDAVVEAIKATEPDIVLVGLGFPKQEYWIRQNINLFDKGLFIGLGGSFDILAGKAKRAPLIWQKLKIEWLHRLLQNPSRWRRMLALPAFGVEILKERFKKA